MHAKTALGFLAAAASLTAPAYAASGTGQTTRCEYLLSLSLCEITDRPRGKKKG